jgi:hypothetical protein
MNRHIVLTVCLIVIASAGLAPGAWATEDRQGPIFAMTEENDDFATLLLGNHTDRHFTQGLKLTYLEGDNDLPRWAADTCQMLPHLAINIDAQNLGYVFGQNMIGGLDAAAAQRLVDMAIEGGINFFDTADVYSYGQSEQILGQALKNKPQNVVLATKLRGRMSIERSTTSG